MQTIALTRAREEAERSAARLAERGFGTVIAPVIETRATGLVPPSGPFAAVIVTSAKAVEALGAESRRAIGSTPVWAVGLRAAEAAARAGLTLAEPPALDGAALMARMRAQLPSAARLLYLAGEDRKAELERGLAGAGHVVETVVVYAARARAAWSDDEAKGIAHCDAVLHYSRRGAELAMSLAKAAGIGDRFRASRHVCLSPDVAEPLRTWGVERLAWSATPREEALFAALEASLR